MRRLHLEESQLADVVQDTLKQLLKGKKTITISPDSMLKLPKPKPDERLNILFSEDAWRKMEALVNGCPKEIAWHGLVKPMDQGFYIYDILVYPQQATAATVESDDEKYTPWLDSLPDDQFNAVRFQGHSHVNMGATPSAVDLDFYETLIQHVNDYYIFFIMNKSEKIWCNIYDVKNNRVYETEDIDIDSEYEGFDYNAWYEDMYKKFMGTKVCAYPTAKGKAKSNVDTIAPGGWAGWNPMDDYDPAYPYGRRGGY